MERIDVVIPTYMRLGKLVECVRSVEDAREFLLPDADVELHIYYTLAEEAEKFAYLQSNKPWIRHHILTDEFHAAKFWNAHLARMTADALCYLTDDVILDHKCLLRGIEEMRLLEFDGVVGFNQANATNGQPVKASFGMVGTKFADRFPERAAFCPDYKCFYLDEEIEAFAKFVGRFSWCKEACLFHLHPAFTGEDPDYTHTRHRRHKGGDVAAYTIRKAENLLWGREFDLVGEGVMDNIKEDKVVSVSEEKGTAMVNMKSGASIPFETNTITTQYASGRQDCTVQMLRPVGARAKAKDLT